MTSDDLRIRPATRTDLPQLYAFEQGIVAAERPLDATIRPGEVHYYDLAALVEAPDACVLVAESWDPAASGARLLGSGFARIRASRPYLSHPRNAYLGFMYVVPEARGRGINGRIVHGLLDWARAQGISEVQLDVYASNQGAVRAYEKLGFRPNLVEMRLALPEEPAVGTPRSRTSPST